MERGELETLHAWHRGSRLVVLALLSLSALQFLALALLARSLGTTSDDDLIFAGSLLFAGLAVGLAVAFRRTGAPTWKHKLAVAVVAAPAAISILVR